MDETEPVVEATEGWKFPRWLSVLIAVAVVGWMGWAFFGPAQPVEKDLESPAMQNARTVALAMFQYAAEHQGNYPTGNSSTEVFQKLLDGKYVADPGIFYLKMSGKSPAASAQLLPENVCYDVTAAMTAQTPADVPCVFATGYRIEYTPNGRAVPLAGQARPDVCSQGLPIAYHDNNVFYKKSQDSSGVVTEVIPPNADLGGTTYTQLAPDGPLP